MSKPDIAHRLLLSTNKMHVQKDGVFHQVKVNFKINGSAQSISVGNAIYVMGGFLNKIGSSHCYYYDAEKNTSGEIDNLIYGKYEFSLIHIDGRIYALGGYDFKDTLSDCQAYTIANNKWNKFKPLNIPRCCGGSYYSKKSETLYCFAGYSNQYENSFESIQISKDDEWHPNKFIAPSSWVPRCDTMACKIADSVILFGGCDLNGAACDDAYIIEDPDNIVLKPINSLKDKAMFYNTSQPVMHLNSIISFDCHGILHCYDCNTKTWQILEIHLKSKI